MCSSDLDPRQSRGSAVGGEHLAERGNRIWRIGQAQRRAIDGAHFETVPAPDWSIMVPAPHEMAVQFNERGGFQLLPGGAERALGDNPVGQVGSVQDLKELVQFPLQRAFDQVQRNCSPPPWRWFRSDSVRWHFPWQILVDVVIAA